MYERDKIHWVRKSGIAQLAMRSDLKVKSLRFSAKGKGIKKIASSLKKFIGRPLKWVIRPFAVRWRNYMAEPLLDQLYQIRDKQLETDKVITALTKGSSNLQVSKITPVSVVVLGACGHAKVIIELLRASGYTVGYCIGRDTDPQTCLGVPVLRGRDEDVLRDLHEEGHRHAFVAIGDNKIRQQLGNLVLEQGYTLSNAISPAATVSPSVTIGQGVAIMAGAVINADVTIGDFAIINTGATVDHDAKIGKAAHIAPQSALAGNVSIADRVTLGVGSKVIPEINIGKDTVVGAGSVVVHDLPENVTAYGVPALVVDKSKGSAA